MTEPKNVSPEQRVREYSDESLTVSSGFLFCRACREKLSLKSSSLKNHNNSKKHIDSKDKIKTKVAHEQEIAGALKKYNTDVHPRGETLPEAQQIYQIKVARTFLTAGVPFNKVEIFRDLLEENGYRLSDKRFMLDLIPFIRQQEEQTIEELLKGRYISIIFDGTTRLGEAIVIVARFVSDSWEIEQSILSIQMLMKSVNGEKLARELVHVLSVKFSIGGGHLIASMRDRASVNNVAMRTLKVIYPEILDIGCFAHTIDRVGEHFKVPHVSEFFTSWMAIFSHSSKAKILWKEQTGKSMLSYSSTRWWSKWEIFFLVMYMFFFRIIA